MNQQLSQQGQTKEFDVLVIGSGLAGLHYCLQLVKLKTDIRIALISKASLDECNTRYAQGGIAAVTTLEDSLQAHIEDTLLAGDGLCHYKSVKYIVQHGSEAIADLSDYAIYFAKNLQGEPELAREGGHSHRRIFNTGDATGLTVTTALLKHIKQCTQITLFEHHTAVNLITHYHPHVMTNQGEVVGAYILDNKSLLIHTFIARAVVLATGGAGKTYRFTSNPMIATGDGLAMAYRAGARVGNLEFYQFHPTLLHHPTLNNFLISEAVRGEGGLLKNAETGTRFMTRYAPEQLELATRDVVSRAIFNEIESSGYGYVHLDITHQPKAFLQKRFPQIYATLQSVGIQMEQDMIPVVPAAHYQCGGVLTDLHGRTDLKRLYAIGEVAFTGLHGANRLASNSLLEALVMAKSAAHSSLKELNMPHKDKLFIANWNSPSEINARRASQINAHWLGLRGEMTSYAGIVRTQAGLEDVLQLITQRKKIIEEYYKSHCITQDYIELRNIVLNAELIVQAALVRCESRGGHYREDFPQKYPFIRESISRQTLSHDLFA
ncbi:MAG TPA: L-aspartate oxidase [Legionellales bacterium]|nr:L-aspartate oxidase [Legionellales bacterium]